MPRSKIAKDRLRFPYRRGVVLNHGNAAMGIHREEIRRIEPAKLPPGIDMLMRQFELADQPHDLLEVKRTAASPDLQHFALLRVSTWRRFAEVLRQLLRGLGQRPKTPCTDHEFSVGPGIPDPDDIDLHRPRASFGRDF